MGIPSRCPGKGKRLSLLAAQWHSLGEVWGCVCLWGVGGGSQLLRGERGCFWGRHASGRSCGDALSGAEGPPRRCWAWRGVVPGLAHLLPKASPCVRGAAPQRVSPQLLQRGGRCRVAYQLQRELGAAATGRTQGDAHLAGIGGCKCLAGISRLLLKGGSWDGAVLEVVPTVGSGCLVIIVLLHTGRAEGSLFCPGF